MVSNEPATAISRVIRWPGKTRRMGCLRQEFCQRWNVQLDLKRRKLPQQLVNPRHDVELEIDSRVMFWIFLVQLWGAGEP